MLKKKEKLVKTNKGHEYEDNFVATLTQVRLASPGHTTGKNATDAYICDFLVELKKNMAAHYLQKSLHWINREKGWQFAKPDPKRPLNKFVECLSSIPSILEYINQEWPEPVRRFKNVHGQNVSDFLTDTDRIEELYDIQEHIDITNAQMMEMIRSFYSDKNITYMHVGGGYGLYHLYDDHGHFLTPRFDNGTAKLRARLKKTSSADEEEDTKDSYHFQLQLEMTSLPKSPIDLNDPVMLQSFIDRHQDGFVSGKWKLDHWDRLKPLLKLGFIKELPPKPIRKDNEQVSSGFRSEAGSFSHSLAL